MNEGDRITPPDSLLAMQAALNRIEAQSTRAAKYSFQAYQLAAVANRRNVVVPYVGVGFAVMMSVLALLVSCGVVK